MKDLKQTLADRADRSTPAGSERLRQRVALTLAGGGRLGAEPRRAPRGPLVAVGAAALVLAVFGVVALLLRGGDTPVADRPSTTVPATTTVPTTAPPSTTAAPGMPTTGVNPDGTPIWSNRDPIGVVLSLDPALVPGVPGRYEIVVDADRYEAWTKVWACPGLGGIVEPDLADAAPLLEDLCDPLQPLEDEAVFPAAVEVDLTEADLLEGGVVLAVNGALGDWAGTALLRTESPAFAGWQLIEPDTGVDSLQLESFGETAAAVGLGGVWLTGDGVAWDHSLQLEPPDRAGVARIVEHDGGLIAAGSRFEPEGESELLVWASPDGSQWTESVVSAFPFPYEPSPSALAAGEPGLVLAVDTTGWVQAEEPGTDLWVSSDGTAWTAVPPSESGLEGIGIADIAAIGGRFAATGSECDANGCIFSVWTSEDGARWSPVPGTEVTDRAPVLEPLLRLGDDLAWIAGGAVLGSADGLVWSPIGTLPESFAALDLTDASVTGLGLTVTTHRWPAEDAVFEPPDADVWFSATGAAWERIPDPDGLLSDAWVWQVASLGDRILVLGEVPDPDAADPADRLQRVWVFTPEGSGS